MNSDELGLRIVEAKNDLFPAQGDLPSSFSESAPLFMVFHENTDQSRRHLLDKRRRESFDQVLEIGHDLHLEEDWEACRDIGAVMQRDAARWHITNPSKSRFDWDWMDRLVEVAGGELIIDYWHYGYPRWISLPAFLSHEFVEYAGRFASMIASRYPEVSHHLPCNEARVGADQIDSGVWRPYLRHRRDEVFAQMAKASIQMAHQIKRVNPNAAIVTAEPVNSPGEETYDEFLALTDAMLGRAHPQWGGRQSLVDVIGINHYAEPDNSSRMLRSILMDMRDRYRDKTIWISEAGNVDELGYLTYVVNETYQANQSHARIEAVTQAPIISSTPWTGERRVDRGGFFTWDIDDPSKTRRMIEGVNDVLPSLSERGFLKTRS